MNPWRRWKDNISQLLRPQTIFPIFLSSDRTYVTINLQCKWTIFFYFFTEPNVSQCKHATVALNRNYIIVTTHTQMAINKQTHKHCIICSMKKMIMYKRHQCDCSSAMLNCMDAAILKDSCGV